MIKISYPPPSASRISLQPDAKTPSILQLSKNEIIQGRVLKSFPSDRVLLLIEGKRLMARTLVPLSEGKVLSLKVEELIPFPTLKLLGTNSPSSDNINMASILSAIKQNLWKTALETMNHHSLQKEALFPFKDLINDVSQRLFLETPPDLLRAIVDKSGLRWEAKLKRYVMSRGIGGDHLNKLVEGDLKGLASKLIGYEENEGGLLKSLVSATKNIQLLNVLALEQDRKVFLPIPIQFPDGFFTVGQLLIHHLRKEKDEPKKQKTEKGAFRVTFLLELSHIGPLRADLTIRGKDIEGHFLVTREEAKQLIEKKIPIFTSKLENRGFSAHHIMCHLKEPEDVSQSLINEIIQEEGHTLSLIA